MALITNYATLQTAIGDYLNRSDLSTFLPNFTQNAEAKLYKVLRIRAMETALNDTIAGGVVALPSDYIELKYAYINTTPARFLSRITPEKLYEDYPVRSGSSMPQVIAVEGGNFIFGPYPGSYAVAGVYYARLPSLSASNTTNWFTANAPDLLLYGSLLEAEPFILNDERLPVWKAFYGAALKAVQDEERRERSSGSTLRVRLG
jgi:hypothetical protein